MDCDAAMWKDPTRYKFVCSVNADEYEEIVVYNELLNHIEDDFEDKGNVWKFKSISLHQGPLTVNSPYYKGSWFDVLFQEWETGEQTYEPLLIVAADDPVTCAIYAKKNNLLKEEG